MCQSWRHCLRNDSDIDWNAWMLLRQHLPLEAASVMCNLKPRGSDSENCSETRWACFTELNLCSGRHIRAVPNHRRGWCQQQHPCTPTTWHPQTHIFSLYHIFNSEGYCQCKCVHRLTSSSGAEADRNKKASVTQKNNPFCNNNNNFIMTTIIKEIYSMKAFPYKTYVKCFIIKRKI